jgi:hypothetical protein
VRFLGAAQRFFIVAGIYALAGPPLCTAFLISAPLLLGLISGPNDFSERSRELLDIALSVFPMGFEIGFLPWAGCGIVLGTVAAWRGSFGIWAAGWAGFMLAVIFVPGFNFVMSAKYNNHASDIFGVAILFSWSRSQFLPFLLPCVAA